MSNGNQGFVPIIKVADFPAFAPPRDITEGRILTRLETANEPHGVGNETPQFYTIARECTHQGCDILLGGWQDPCRPPARPEWGLRVSLPDLSTAGP